MYIQDITQNVLEEVQEEIIARLVLLSAENERLQRALLAKQ